MQVRDEEMDELDQLQNEYCEYIPKGGSENIHGKVNILLQAFLSRGRVKSFSLISDIAYIAQVRMLFSILMYIFKNTVYINLCYLFNDSRMQVVLCELYLILF